MLSSMVKAEVVPSNAVGPNTALTLPVKAARYHAVMRYAEACGTRLSRLAGLRLGWLCPMT
jgi:hypothetical protein